MKKRLVLVLLLFLMGVTIPANAATNIKEKLSQIGFHSMLQKDENAEIIKFFKKQQHYTNRKNEKKLREMFSSDFLDTDGITRDKLMTAVTSVWSLYENLDYKTSVDSVKINGNYATVEITDTIQGTTKVPYDAKIKGKGVFKAEAKSYNYLQKINGEWKITSATVISDKTSLLYGSAINTPMDIIAPEGVKANEQYNVILDIEVPEKYAAIASITSEIIEFPAKRTAISQDIFRSLKQDGELERVLTANNRGFNEEAMGCVSLAKAVVNTQTNQISVVIDGVGFISSRVNVIPKKEVNNE